VTAHRDAVRHQGPETLFFTPVKQDLQKINTYLFIRYDFPFKGAVTGAN
jgi:hypothetical protein